MAKYLILIHGDEERWGAMTADELAELDAAHRAFNERAGDAVLAGGALQPTALAASLRTGTDGAPVTVDGPFAEAKEVVGGFYLVEADSREEVVALAAGLREARQGHGGIEVRPMVVR